MRQFPVKYTLYAVFILAAVLLLAPVMAAGTTSVHIVKYANDNTTILNETTVDFAWMEANLPVLGDGVTHYYLQGPVMNESITDKWNPEENDTAILTKDFGAVKGTDLKDLCELVGGMQSDDYNVTLKASDGFKKAFAYSSIYNPPARAGPIVLTWYRADQGYVNGSYSAGIRNVMFADTSTNPWGYHVFGLWDMHEAYPEPFWYFFEPGAPSTTGLSVQNIDRVLIYTNDPAPLSANFTANVTTGQVPLTVQFNDTSTGGPTSWAWDFFNDGTIDSNVRNPVYTFPVPGNYPVNLTVTNADGRDSELKTNFIHVTTIPTLNVIYNGTVTLSDGNFTWSDYKTGTTYTARNLTPHAAIDAASLTGGFTYGDTYKSAITGAIIDWINSGAVNYTYNGTPSPKLTWNYQLNGVYKNYFSNVTGIDNQTIVDGDYIEFYYGPDQQTTANATAVVRITVDIPSPPSSMDVLYNGTITLTPGETFTQLAYNTGTNYTINRTTPLGALNAAASVAGFSYDVTDKRWSYDQVLLLDNISVYNKSAGKWYAYVNGVFKDGYQNHPDGLNVIGLANNDQVNFFYSTGTNLTAPDDAIAAVKIKVNIGGSTTSNWSLSLKGARNYTITQTFFEQGLACPSSGHQVNWTDADGSEWSGVPLWLLVGVIDDNPDVGPDHFNFNDSLAAQGYSVKITAGDGFNTTIASADIARNNGYIVANKLNGSDLPLLTPGGKRSWPLHLKGSAVFGGQQVGNITMIELTGMPQPSAGWTLTMEGDVTDVITQEYFEQAIACHHNVTYTDAGGSVWTGVALWDLVGSVDDIETTSHWTFNDTRANVTGYTVRVIAGDGFNKTFDSLNVSHNNGFIVANTLNGSALSGTNGHLKLVGPATTSGQQRVGNITTICLEGLPSYPAGAYSLSLKGKISDIIPEPELEAWIAENTATYTDSDGNAYSGIPLWHLLGWVDDRIPAGPNGFNEATAAAGYKVIVKAGDGYSKEISSSRIGENNDFIVANMLNGTPLPTTGSHPPWPLRLVGAGLSSSSESVGNLAEIELTDFQTAQTAAPLHIIKYGSDGVTIINQTNVTYQWMEANLPVIGDGTTVYRFESITGNTSNIWDPEETYPGGYKIENVVKGSRLHDLCELVGGMGTGTEIKLVASDGYETALPYSSVYTDPAVQARQGDAILAWWGDGQYVPYYADGMRLFFMPDDHVYGQWDMNQTLPSTYYHYYYQDNIFYPSCAGLSAKYVTTIKIYSAPSTDWTLDVDGRDIGGLDSSISKTYFEQALACQMGGNHSATYSDSAGRIWEGMPLWFLCGFVDDADQHSDNAYNETKALAGYNITVTGTDGYNYTFDSRDTIRNANYIVANTLNGTPIPETDSSWPLRLVGQNVTGGKIVKKIASIKLTPQATLPPETPTISVIPASQSFPVGTSREYQIVMNTIPPGLAGYDLVVTCSNASVAEILSISYPSWAGLNNNTAITPSSLKLSAVDTNRLIQLNATNLVLANVTVKGNAVGTTSIVITKVHMDTDGGGTITPVVVNGRAIVYGPLTADFSGTPRTGMASRNVSLDVNFTDLTTGSPNATAWHWDFGTLGNGNTSTAHNPKAHYYGVIGSVSNSSLVRLYGNHTVTLIASNAYNQSTKIRTDYIYITPLVKPFPGYTLLPTDTNGDWMMEDINGNGNLDYDDVVAYYQNMQWIRDQTDVGVEPYDYNNNGRIDYDDVVVLYWIILDSHP